MPGTAELRRHLSRFLKRVRAGERIIITDRGEPVAEVIPYRHEAAADTLAARVAYLASRGALSLPRRPLSEPLKPVRPARSASLSPASDAVTKDREAAR
jgi:prevent-host-death family protein